MKKYIYHCLVNTNMLDESIKYNKELIDMADYKLISLVILILTSSFLMVLFFGSTVHEKVSIFIFIIYFIYLITLTGALEDENGKVPLGFWKYALISGFLFSTFSFIISYILMPSIIVSSFTVLPIILGSSLVIIQLIDSR